MKLILTNFRCHGDLKLNVANSGVHLLQGPSGAGKSTILNAIYWVLYGTLTKPRMFNKSSCSVRITYGKYIVIRSSNPARLELKHGNSSWTDSPAQGVINSLFGTHEEFLLTSFIRQKTQASIVFSTPGKQKEVISKLASSEEEATACRIVVKQRLGDVTRSKTKSEAKIDLIENQYSDIKTECMRLEDSLSGFTIDVARWKRMYRSLKDRIRSQKKNEEIVRRKIQNAKHLIALKSNLDALRVSTEDRVLENETRIRVLKDTESEFPDDSRIVDEHGFRQELDALKLCRKEYMQAEESFNLQTQARLESLKSEVSPDKLKEYSEYSEQIQPQIDRLESMIEFIRECERSSLDIKIPGPKCPEAAVLCDSSHTTLLDIISRWNSFSNEVLDAVNVDMPIFNKTLKRLNSDKLGVMKCPKCETSLRCVNSKLCLAKKMDTVRGSELSLTLLDVNSKLSWDYVNNLRIKYLKIESEWRSILERAENMKLDQASYSETSYPQLMSMLEEAKLELGLEERRAQQRKKIPTSDESTEKKKRKWLRVRSKLRDGVGKDILKRGYLHELYSGLSTSEIADRVKEYVIWKGAKMDRDKEIYLCELNITELKKILKDKENEYRRIPKTTETLESLQERHRELTERIQIDEEKHRKNQEMKVKVKTYISLCELRAKADTMSDELAQLNKELDLQLSEEASLIKLKALIDRAEAISISNVVHTINTFARQYLNLMFDEPIQVELLAVTETQKGKIRYSPSVNILYRGSQYSSVHELSGGEQDRISLAFLLAVNEMTHSKILMLDECLSSISSSQNSLIVKGLESFARRQPILVVQHNGVEGVFDSVIQV
jgi:DNA repair exonuclease SbcCD ATPase subunit